MEFFSHPVPAVIFLLGILVFVHEFGHFIVGKYYGIGIEIFSIGFGPKLFGFMKNGTDYRLSWIPLGGYVKFVGSSPTEEIPEHLKGKEFYKAPVWKRVAVVAAGPLANFLLAIFAYTLLGFSGIPHPPPVIGQVIAGSPAEMAGLKFNDIVKKIDHENIKTWYDLERIISKSAGKKLKFVVLRQILEKSQEITIELTPESVEGFDLADQKITRGRAGIALGKLPSVITIVDAYGPAYQAGLKTGDQITAVEFNGASFEVKFFPELYNALFAAFRAEADSIAVKIRRFETPLSEEEAEKTSLIERKFEEKIALLPARASWSKLRAGIQDENQFSTAHFETLTKNLGFIDSEITIDHIDKNLKGVLQRGDSLLAWNGQELKSVYQLTDLIRNNKDESAKIKFLRFVSASVPSNFAGDRELKEFELDVKLKGVDTQRPSGKVTIFTLPVSFMGQSIDPDPLIEKYNNPFSALFYGIKQSFIEIGSLLVAIWKLIIGEFPLKALGGPLLIAKVAGDSVKLGWQVFTNSLAMISLNLAILNLFPIPVLDGGQLVIFGVEIYRRRPMRISSIENFQKIGFVMIMALVVLATYNDISRFWKSILESVLGVF